MIKISPSLLAADFSDLRNELNKVKTADYIHLDVMDGIFVPNISFGPGVISAIKPYTDLLFDVHLMIKDPIRYVDEFVKSGADIITIHAESCFNIAETLKYIKSNKIKAALSIKPNTKPRIISDYLEYTDMILVMTVEPGFGGQSFITHTVDNIREVKKITEGKIDIEVDGGISELNAGVVAEAGANVLVAGSSVFKSENPENAIYNIRKAAEASYK